MRRVIVEGIEIQVARKKIKRLSLRVCPPDGQVRVSAPRRFSEREIRAVVVEKLGWIKKHRARFLAQPKPVQPRFADGETHYYFGDPLQLEVRQTTGRQRVEIDRQVLRMHVKPGAAMEKRQRLLDEWYRGKLKERIPALIAKWEPIVGRRVAQWGVKKMKTRWGSCNIDKRRIWLNLELAKKPSVCLEYIIVHEMVHLLERYHNANFKQYMDRFMPAWREYDSLLLAQ